MLLYHGTLLDGADGIKSVHHIRRTLGDCYVTGENLSATNSQLKWPVGRRDALHARHRVVSYRIDEASLCRHFLFN